MTELPEPKITYPQKGMTDFSVLDHEEVEVLISPNNTTVWINIKGICIFRISKINPKNLEVNDQGATNRSE
jgi:hypothetical protein